MERLITLVLFFILLALQTAHSTNVTSSPTVVNSTNATVAAAVSTIVTTAVNATPSTAVVSDTTAVDATPTPIVVANTTAVGATPTTAVVAGTTALNAATDATTFVTNVNKVVTTVANTVVVNTATIAASGVVTVVPTTTVSSGGAVNECTLSTNNKCSPNATCTDTVKGYNCTCKTGFSGNGYNCTDDDECTPTSDCSTHAVCNNTMGSYTCTCKDGFTGDGKICTEICNDQCKVDKYSTCKTQENSNVTCECIAGYSLENNKCQKSKVVGTEIILKDKTFGEDYTNENSAVYKETKKNITSLLNGVFNKTKGYLGSGLTGFKSGSVIAITFLIFNSNTSISNQNLTDTLVAAVNNGAFSSLGSVSNTITVEDFDECKDTSTHGCSTNGVCTNVPYTYSCKCKTGYTGDGYTCTAEPAEEDEAEGLAGWEMALIIVGVLLVIAIIVVVLIVVFAKKRSNTVESTKQENEPDA